MKKIYALLLTLLLLAPTITFAGRGHGSYSHSSSSRSTHVKSYVPEREKTVHVHAYTKKDGTHVEAYNRRPPNSVRK